MRAKKLVQTIIGAAAFCPEDITVKPEMNEINIAAANWSTSGAGANLTSQRRRGTTRGAWTLVENPDIREAAYIEAASSRGYAAGNMAW